MDYAPNTSLHKKLISACKTAISRHKDGSLSAIAPAKINLYLHITGKREDGYHLLDSLFVFARQGDVITVRKSDVWGLEIGGRFGGGLEGCNGNLISKAAKLLAEHVTPPFPVHIRLEKNLPIASGIGGGSSDAATALLLLAALWEIEEEKVAPLLMSLAPELGADVLPCLFRQSCHVTGIGDKVALLDDFVLPPLLLINPQTAPLSAKTIYQAAAITQFDAPVDDPKAITQYTNRLQPAALRLAPVISEVLDWLAQQEGCTLARMSGSGATCFGLFPDAALRDNAYKALPEGWWGMVG